MKPVNRALVEELLLDEALSYREVARRAGCSDWSVRAIDRERSGGPPMKARSFLSHGEPEEPSRQLTGAETAIGWGIAIVFFVGFLALSWYGRRDDFPSHNQREGPMR